MAAQRNHDVSDARSMRLEKRLQHRPGGLARRNHGQLGIRRQRMFLERSDEQTLRIAGLERRVEDPAQLSMCSRARCGVRRRAQ
jgi:hypothetical protein